MALLFSVGREGAHALGRLAVGISETNDQSSIPSHCPHSALPASLSLLPLPALPQSCTLLQPCVAYAATSQPLHASVRQGEGALPISMPPVDASHANANACCLSLWFSQPFSPWVQSGPLYKSTTWLPQYLFVRTMHQTAPRPTPPSAILRHPSRPPGPPHSPTCAPSLLLACPQLSAGSTIDLDDSNPFHMSLSGMFPNTGVYLAHNTGPYNLRVR
jgi:hypothetical protein